MRVSKFTMLVASLASSVDDSADWNLFWDGLGVTSPAPVVAKSTKKQSATKAVKPSITTTVEPTSTSTVKPTTTIKPIRTYDVPMVSNFEFGLQYVIIGRKRIAALPLGVQAACPRDRDYCIDTRYSGADVCMHPAPLTIKKCLDDTCASMPSNEQIFKQYGEDSYCKDFQIASGRVCHWTTTPCTCLSMDIKYVTAVLARPDSPAPSNYRLAKACEYPDNYKATNWRENENVAATKRPPPSGGRLNQSTPKDATLPITTFVLLLVMLVV